VHARHFPSTRLRVEACHYRVPGDRTPFDAAKLDRFALPSVRQRTGNFVPCRILWRFCHCSLGLSSTGRAQATETQMASTNMTTASPNPEFIEFAQEVFQRARTGDATTLSRLLEKGLPPNMSNHKGDTLLMLSAYHGHVEATRVLLEAGAEPDRYNDMAQTPLGASTFKGYLPIVELLLLHGAGPEFAPPGGKTPLMFAAMFNRLDIMKLLLARNVDIETRSSDGLTALALARNMGASDAAAYLEAIEAGGGAT
jgi:uncharacterized protein